MIPFNIPYISGKEEIFIGEAIQGKNLAGDGYFTKKCQQFLENFTKSPNVLLTTSCTHALELSALLCDIQPGDEVIMSSFTFVSSANAFVLRGAKIVFVDIRPDTMNIDERLIEDAITSKTKAILAMHYAGVACAMNEIMAIAKEHQLFVIEDAAQCIDAYYDQKHLGAIGHLGTFSFHSTKNIHCGEGGALLVNDKKLIERAEIIREKGTNRKSFLRGEVDKYSWVDIGSSYLMSELNAAFLYSQLQDVKEVTKKRLQLLKHYQTIIKEFYLENDFEVTDHCISNGHIVYIKLKDKSSRNALIQYLEKENIISTFHYVPLHTSVYGKKGGRFCGEDVFTTRESNRLLRLPIYYDLKMEEVELILKKVLSFQKQIV
jgi:dTDP-4-amino-4,6-dideoxygalactose transaminase